MRTFDKLCVGTYIVGITFLLIARDVIGISISKWLFVGLATAFMFVSSLPAMIYMVSFTIPLLCGLPGTYLMLIACAFMILKIGKLESRVLVAIVVMVILEAVAAIWYPRVDYVEIAGYLFHIAVFFMLISNFVIDNVAIDGKKLAQMYVLGSFVLCTIIIVMGIKTAPDDWLSQYAKGFYRFGARHAEEATGMTLTLNANNLGYYSIVGCFLSVFMWRKGYCKKINLVSVIVHLMAGVLSLSRSFLLISVGCFLIMVLCSGKNIKTFGVLLISLLLALFAINFINEKYPDVLVGWTTRLTRDDMATGHGRTDLMVMYFEAWINEPRSILFGTGVTEYKTITGIYDSLHNATEQVLVCYGVFGATFFLYFMLYPLMHISRKRKLAMIDWVPTISLLMFVQTIQFVDPVMLMMPYVAVIHAMNFRA